MSLGQMMGRLGDHGHINKVIEQLEKADSSTRSGLAMRPRWPPEPALERAKGLAGHGDTLASRGIRVGQVAPQALTLRSPNHADIAEKTHSDSDGLTWCSSVAG
jgi:hypothetical protein